MIRNYVASISIGDTLTAPGARFSINSYNQVKNYLGSAGIPANIVPWAAAQSAFETNGWKSNVSTKDFNLSGITWINKPAQNATRGVARPASEGGYYAHYKSYTDWAKDLKRILEIGGTGAAIYATSLQDYVDRLYKNKYFTSSPGPYYQALNMILQSVGDLQKQQGAELQQAQEDAKAWYLKIEDWAKANPGMAIGAGLLGLLVVKKVLD